MMSNRQNDDAETARLSREVAALEKLVLHYRELLKGEHVCSNCGQRTAREPRSVQEEVFENQYLRPRDWVAATGNADMPLFSRRNGQACTFDDVSLPSGEWEWVSDWEFDVDSETDQDGWMYATSWHALNDKRQTSSATRNDDSVRRRRWKRERMYVGSKDLPSAIGSNLQDKKLISVLESDNMRLAQKLQHTRDQLQEVEQRANEYEATIARLQRIARTTAPNGHRKRVASIEDAEKLLTKGSNPREAFAQAPGDDTARPSSPLAVRSNSMEVIDEATRKARLLRAQMVQACELELQSAASEFGDLLRAFHQDGSD